MARSLQVCARCALSCVLRVQAVVADGGMSNSMGFRLVKKKRDAKNKFELGMSKGAG